LAIFFLSFLLQWNVNVLEAFNSPKGHNPAIAYLQKTHLHSSQAQNLWAFTAHHRGTVTVIMPIESQIF
jgi:hypothetical protein